MRNFLIFIAILVGLTLIGKACGDDGTVSYYQDVNGNGRQDWGEGVWYEDEDGVHFYD